LRVVSKSDGFQFPILLCLVLDTRGEVSEERRSRLCMLYERTSDARPLWMFHFYLLSAGRPVTTRNSFTQARRRVKCFGCLSLDVKAATTLYSNSSQPRLFGVSVARSLGLKDHSQSLADSW